MKKLQTLLLSHRDVQGLVDMGQAIAAIENIFREYGSGRANMPPKIYLDLPQYHGDFRAMPAFASRIGKASLKWVNTHAQNSKKHLPSVMAIIILSDPVTGFPLCIMDGTVLTGVRTGAAGGVAAKYLAKPNSSVVGLVGCGVQARTQLEALREVFKIRQVKVWGKENSLAKKFVRERHCPKEKMDIAATIEDCVRECDIVVTTTPSHAPIVKASWIAPGTHINAIGADAAGKQELDPKIIKTAKLVVDDIRQASHSGEINVPFSKGMITTKNIYAELGKIVCGQKFGRRSNQEITVFDSTGLAIQDLAIADLVYRMAIKKKIKRFIRFIE